MSKGQRLRRLQQTTKPAVVNKETEKSSSDSDSSKDEGKDVCAAITTGFYFGKLETVGVERKKTLSKKVPWSQSESAPRSPVVPVVPVKPEPTFNEDDYWYYDNVSNGYFYGNAGGMGWRRLMFVPSSDGMGWRRMKSSQKETKEDSGTSSSGNCSPPVSEESVPDISRVSVASDEEKKVEVKAPWDDSQDSWKSSWDKPLFENPNADEDALAEKIKLSASIWK